MAANVKNDFNRAFCPPLPGKPGPYSSDAKTRFRVSQSPQKGETCGYYALQILRDQKKIGKHGLDSQAEDRLKEKAISELRKAHTKLDRKFQAELQLATGLIQDFSGHCTKKDAQEILDYHLSSIFPKYRKALAETLRSFCAQSECDDFLEYVQERYGKARLDVDLHFLETFKLPPEKWEKPVAKGLKPWEDKTMWERAAYLAMMTFLVSAEAYGCKYSFWHPNHQIDGLIEQLNLSGPHLVIGEIGKSYYVDPPSPFRKKMEGRSVFYWKPGSSRAKDQGYHAVVIVGAEKDKRRVYFMDPRDGSTPNDLNSQKIYAISYERLRTSIVSLERIKGKIKADGMPAFLPMQPKTNHYALYIKR